MDRRHRLARRLTMLALCATVPSAALAQDRLAPRAVVAIPVGATKPVIDGRLDDPVWRDAIPATDFVQSRPNPAAAASARTEARVAFDDDALYIAVRAFDPKPASIVAPYPRRDDETTSDWIFVEIDGRHDRRSAFSFGVNPRGVQVDGTFSDDVYYDAAWNGVWQAVARVDSLGWTAEYRIPFSQIALGAPASGTRELAIGFNVYRYTPRLGESSNWSPRLPTLAGVVSHFNALTGVTAPPHARQIEVTPYVAARTAHAPPNVGDLASASLPRGTTSLAGVDARARLGPSLTLTATLHPDFGQVEADPSVVNLTTFETFFPEQRPFFVEGASQFAFNGGTGFGDPFHSRGRAFDAESPFYSRRIGRRPRGGAPSDVRVLDAPAATDLLGAAKVAGRTSSGWAFGALGAATAQESAHVLDVGGDTRRLVVEPSSQVMVARATRDFRHGGSAIGAVVTGLHRASTSDPLGTLLPRDATTLAVDGRHRFGGDAYEIDGFAAASRIAGSAAGIRAIERAPNHYLLRPDASHLSSYLGDSTRTSLGGTSAQLRLARLVGHWQWSATGHAISPGFEVNDVGFQRYSDWVLGVGALHYVSYTPGPLFRRWSLGVDQLGAGWSFGGERRAAVATVSASADLHDNWGGALTLGREASALSTEVLRGGPALLLPPRLTWSASLHSDTRRRTQATLSASGFHEASPDSRELTLDALVDARLTDRVRVSLGPSVSDASLAWQFVGRSAATSDIVGRLHQRTASLVTRADVALSSRFTAQLFAQPLIGSARYDDFGAVLSPRAALASDRVRATTLSTTGIGDPSFGTHDAIVNAVVRWEYRLGSAIYVVWSDQRTGPTIDPRWDVTHALRDLRTTPSTNVLLVKWSYWWAP